MCSTPRSPLTVTPCPPLPITVAMPTRWTSTARSQTGAAARSCCYLGKHNRPWREHHRRHHPGTSGGLPPQQREVPAGVDQQRGTTVQHHSVRRKIGSGQCVHRNIPPATAATAGGCRTGRRGVRRHQRQPNLQPNRCLHPVGKGNCKNGGAARRRSATVRVPTHVVGYRDGCGEVEHGSPHHPTPNGLQNAMTSSEERRSAEAAGSRLLHREGRFSA